MSAVSDLDLPEFDYTDQELRGQRYRAAMRALEGNGWIYSGPLGFLVVEREAGEFFLRTKSAQFPGLTMAELFDVQDGPLHREMTGNIINVNGDDHRRLRNLVNPAFAPRAADQHRPAMRGFLEQLLAAVARGRALRVRGRVRQALSVDDHRPRARRAAGGRAAAAPLVELDPAPVRRGLADERARADRAKPCVEAYAYLDELLAARRDVAGR